MAYSPEPFSNSRVPPPNLAADTQRHTRTHTQTEARRLKAVLQKFGFQLLQEPANLELTNEMAILVNRAMPRAKPCSTICTQPTRSHLATMPCTSKQATCLRWQRINDNQPIRGQAQTVLFAVEVATMLLIAPGRIWLSTIEVRICAAAVLKRKPQPWKLNPTHATACMLPTAQRFDHG